MRGNVLQPLPASLPEVVEERPMSYSGQNLPPFDQTIGFILHPAMMGSPQIWVSDFHAYLK